MKITDTLNNIHELGRRQKPTLTSDLYSPHGTPAVDQATDDALFIDAREPVSDYLATKLSEALSYPVGEVLFFHAITFLVREGVAEFVDLIELDRTELALFTLTYLDQELRELGNITLEVYDEERI